MRSIEITNIKGFTAQLFAGTEFDQLLVTEVQINTAVAFTIDGHLDREFVGEEEMQDPANQEGIIRWQKLRPVCFEIIKGKKVPRQFRIVFKMPADMVQQFLQGSGCVIRQDQISGLYLNISFKNNQLSCTTGTSMTSFTMDKSLDQLWDEYMEQRLKIWK